MAGYLYRLPAASQGELEPANQAWPFDHARDIEQLGSEVGLSGVLLKEVQLVVCPETRAVCSLCARYCTPCRIAETLGTPWVGVTDAFLELSKHVTITVPSRESIQSVHLSLVRTGNGVLQEQLGWRLANLTLGTSAGHLVGAGIPAAQPEKVVDMYVPAALQVAGLYGCCLPEGINVSGLYLCPSVPCSWSAESHGMLPPPFKQQVRTLLSCLRYQEVAGFIPGNVKIELVRQLYHITFFSADPPGSRHDFLGQWYQTQMHSVKQRVFETRNWRPQWQEADNLWVAEPYAGEHDDEQFYGD